MHGPISHTLFAMPVATQLEILDLRHFTARQLRPVLEAEVRMWRERLSWDYQGSAELLLQYLDSRVLPGFVALDRGRISGFTFCVYEGHKAVIGDAFAVAPDQALQLAITQQLLQQLLQLLRHSPGIDRVESQLLLYPSGAVDETFLAAGFRMHPRLYMQHDLESFQPAPSAPALPEAIELLHWNATHYQASAELIHSAYVDHIDSSINDQYCSLHGSLRFLHNIVRFPGCGVFDPDSSWILCERDTGALIGMVLCSRVAHDVAHITQFCIAPTHRGTGLGRALIEHAVAHLARTGFRAITLTVTEANDKAVRLYESHGFYSRHRFNAMVFDKSQR